jgi:flagellar biosynthesis/type III secretory pathway ATPase
LDEYIIVISDGEESITVNCKAENVASVIAEFIKDEYLMIATIVKAIGEETYES